MTVPASVLLSGKRLVRHFEERMKDVYSLELAMLWKDGHSDEQWACF
jgi:hypothetical protein